MALMFLTVLTMIGTVAVTTGVSEERMARATRDYNVAFQAAEAALQDAKNDLIANGSRTPVIIANVGFDTACTAALCLKATPGNPPVWEVAANWNNAATYGLYTFAQTLPTAGPGAVAQQPRYLLEYIAQVGAQHIYRITARGYGPNAAMLVTLQEEVLR